ncbi:MAG: ribonuclease HI family protein [Myxococcota bacterium]|nr:ribonuclease HI family protein [Myxococcota bacterium]
METKGLADVLRVIVAEEELPAVARAFSGWDLHQIRHQLSLLADELSPVSFQSNSSEEPTVASGGCVVLKTDGACRGNPGPSGAGWVIYSTGGDVIGVGNEFLGRRTNNEAEYAAVLLGLQAVLELGYSEVDLRADSELLVKQVKGIYRVKNARLKPLYDEVKRLLAKFSRYSVEHIYREKNQEADKQANVAVDRGR